MQPVPNHIVYFDGVCNLCNRSVQLILKNDTAGRLKFAPLQGETAKNIRQRLPEKTDSIVLESGGKLFVKSTAVLKIAGMLRFPFPLFSVFLIIPAFIRNFCYDRIAANRYRWFGKKDACMVPDPSLQSRFLP